MHLLRNNSKLGKNFGYCVTLTRTMEHKMLIYSNQEICMLLFSIKRQTGLF